MALRNEKPSRADQVRARRQIEPVQRKPVPPATQRTARNAQNSSRVIRRRTEYTSSYGDQSARQSAGKRIYMPSGNQGTEIRLPAVPTVNLGWRLLSGMLAVVMIVAMYMMKTSDVFAVSTVNLEGSHRVSAAEIGQALAINGTSMIEIIPGEIEDRIVSQFPDISGASVGVQLPTTLNIAVEERQPVIVWMQGETPMYWVDLEGYVFPVRGTAENVFPVFSVDEPPHPLGWVDPAFPNPETGLVEQQPTAPMVDPAFVHAIQQLAVIVPQGSQMLYERDNGLGWTDPNGWQVYFGTDSEHIEQKLAEYEQIVAAVLAKNLQPKLISMEFLHAPFYRLEQ